jgi:hypothetical protein
MVILVGEQHADDTAHDCRREVWTAGSLLATGVGTIRGLPCAGNQSIFAKQRLSQRPEAIGNRLPVVRLLERGIVCVGREEISEEVEKATPFNHIHGADELIDWQSDLGAAGGQTDERAFFRTSATDKKKALGATLS